MKPIYKYLGGKSRELKYLRPFFPQNYTQYVEPFFGGGAVFWDLEPDRAHLNDTDSELMEFLDIVRSNSDKINEVCLWPNTKEKFLELRDSYGRTVPGDALFSAQRYFYFLRTSFNGCLRYNSKKERYNMSWGGERRIAPISEENVRLLQNTILSDLDWSEVFDLYADNEDAFIFLDPPYDGLFSYLLDSEENKSKNHQMYIDLNERIRAAKAKCLMTINKTPFTEKLFGDLVVSTYSQKQTFGAHCKNKNLIKETLVVANYKINTDGNNLENDKKDKHKSVHYVNKNKTGELKTMKVDTIVLEGIDKCGKDTIAAFLSAMNKYYIVTIRGAMSNTVYPRLFNTKKVEYFPHDNELYVLLQVNEEDWKIRCRITNEPKIDYSKHNDMFEDVAKEFIDRGFRVLKADTSTIPPYVIAKEILNHMDKLNEEE